MDIGVEGLNWISVKSRMLAAIAYNRDWQQLYLKFRSGDVYCYRGVPAERYQELVAADSKGSYVRSRIRPRVDGWREGSDAARSPATGRELSDLGELAIIESGQHIQQILLQWHTHPAAGFDDGEDRGDLRPGFGAAYMQPVLAPQRH